MSRSGYTEDYDGDINLLNLYRASVDRAMSGKRGQAFLRELLAALDAMPDKKLAANVWVEPSGAACALGVVAQARGLTDTIAQFHPDDSSSAAHVGELLGIAESMARELVWINDDGFVHDESDEARWVRVRSFVIRRIKGDRTP